VSPKAVNGLSYWAYHSLRIVRVVGLILETSQDVIQHEGVLPFEITYQLFCSPILSHTTPDTSFHRDESNTKKAERWLFRVYFSSRREIRTRRKEKFLGTCEIYQQLSLLVATYYYVVHSISSTFRMQTGMLNRNHLNIRPSFTHPSRVAFLVFFCLVPHSLPSTPIPNSAAPVDSRPGHARSRK